MQEKILRRLKQNPGLTAKELSKLEGIGNIQPKLSSLIKFKMIERKPAPKREGFLYYLK